MIYIILMSFGSDFEILGTYQSASMETHNNRPLSVERGLRHQKVSADSMVLESFVFSLDKVEAGDSAASHHFVL